MCSILNSQQGATPQIAKTTAEIAGKSVGNLFGCLQLSEPFPGLNWSLLLLPPCFFVNDGPRKIKRVRLSFDRVCDVMLPYESAVSHGCSFRSTCHVRFQNIKYSDGINAQLKVAQY